MLSGWNEHSLSVRRTRPEAQEWDVTDQMLVCPSNIYGEFLTPSVIVFGGVALGGN